MTTPEFAEEVLDDLDLLRARDPRGLLPAVAGAGAQVRETDRLTDEARLGRVTEGGRPRGLVIVARREGAVAASVLRALLGPSSPVTVDVGPGPTLPVGTGPRDRVVVGRRARRTEGGGARARGGGGRRGPPPTKPRGAGSRCWAPGRRARRCMPPAP